MHHKFCVIDRATVIIGSYNWTKRAQANDESITVIAASDGDLETGIAATTSTPSTPSWPNTVKAPPPTKKSPTCA
ncbi:MAG TPA: phospholipase D-like domain-containing protein [Lamprocystis sp. (in: g-proteobacteria)]|nr:phospholipase D-like domain-containing protein [Lamprocystis sp. (in: g-proteobacteria)]